MATRGLSFDNPLYQEPSGIPSPVVNPFGFDQGAAPAPVQSMDAFNAQINNLTAAGIQMARQAPARAQPQAPASAYYSPSKKQFYVQGVAFDEDDAQTLLDTQKLMGGAPIPPPKGEDWTPVDQQSYSQILANVQSPGLGRLASKSFGRGVDQLQMLLGSGLQLAGAEETGERIVAQQAKDLRKTAPYERKFTDVDSASGLVDWFVANLAAQGPNLLESVAAGLIGAAAGSAAAGPGLGTLGGGIAGFFGKKAFKDKVIDAAAKYRAGTITKDSAEFALLRNASALTGATAANFVSSQAMGAADIYGEMREQGVWPEDFSARMTALAGSFPYALAESSTEFLLAGRLFGNRLGRAALPGATTTTTKGAAGTTTVTQGPTRTARGVELLKRGATGFGVGAVAEGGTEVFQEGLVMGLSGQDLGSDEALNRFVNSFAAGAALGGPLGAAANLLSRQPENLLAPGQKAEPTKGRDLMVPSAPSGTGIEPYYTPVTFMGSEGGGPIYTKVGAAQKPIFPTIGAAPIQPPLLPAPPSGTAVAPYYSDVTFAGASGGGPIYNELGGPTAPPQLGAPPPPPVPPTPQLGGPLALGAPPVPPQLGAPVAPVAPVVTEDPLDKALISYRGDPDVGALLLADEIAGESHIRGEMRSIALVYLTQGRDAGRKKLLAEVTDPESGFGLMGLDAAQAQNYINEVDQFLSAKTDVFTGGKSTPRKPRAPRAAGLKKGKKSARVSEASVMAPLQFPDGATYTGEMVDGLPNGQGVYTYPDGSVYTGQIKSARDGSVVLDGQGRFVDADGTVMEGTFQDNVLQEAPAAKAPAPKKAAALKKGKKDAVQEPSAKKVSPRKSAGVSKGVGKKVPAKQTAPAKGEALKSKAKDKKAADVSEIQERLVQDSLKRGELAQAGRKWGQFADPETQPKWKDLSPEQQEKWRQAVADGKPTIAATEEIAPSKKEGTPPKKVVAAPAAAVEVEALTPAEAWEDMKPDGAPVFADLPRAMQDSWTRTVERNRATIEEANLLAEQFAEIDADTVTPLQFISSEITDAETAVDQKDFAGAIRNIVTYAFVMVKESSTSAAVLRAREWLRNTSFTASQQNAIDAMAIELLNAEQNIEAVYRADTKDGDSKGDPKPWFNYASRRGLLPKINTVITGLSLEQATDLINNGSLRTANLPDSTLKAYKAANPDAVAGGAANARNDTKANPAISLANYIREVNSHTGQPFNPQKRTAVIKKLRAMWQAVEDIGMTDFTDQNGVPLADYFTENGEPMTGRIDGQFRIATEVITPEVQARREKAIAEDAEVAEDYDAPFSLDDWNVGKKDDYSDGRNSLFRDDGTPITGPIPIGRVKMLVSLFLSKLGVRPKVQIYANQADFKAKNPQLYKRAAAARPQGDFDTAPAVGYSFGDGNVIIFSDRVVTEKQLKFVLAHETLGHFGFRGLLTEKELNAALDAVYNASDKVKAAVDTIVATQGIPRREAVEEYLADFAGVLDTNVLARFWNSIKNGLNKLGVRFDDDTARYLVSQARRYVRNGDTAGSFVDFKAIVNRMAAVEGMQDPDGAGRFALNGEYYDQVNRMAALDAFGQRSAKLFDLTNLFQQAQDRGINIKDTVSRFISELRTMNFLARENQGYRELYNIFKDTSKTAAQLRAKYNIIMNTVLSPSVELFGTKFTKGATKAQLDTAATMLRAANTAKRAEASAASIRAVEPMVKIVNGQPTINQAVFDKLAARGKITLDQFKKGFKYTVKRTIPATEAYRTGLRTERDAELKKATTDAERKAIDRDYEAQLAEPSMVVNEDVDFPAMPDITDKSPEWIMYSEVRDAMNQSAADLLLANFSAARAARVNVERKATQFLARALTENDKAFLQKISDRYLELYKEGAVVSDLGSITPNKEAIKKANDFVKAFNTALLGKESDLNADVQKFFEQAEADDVFKGIEALKKDSTIQRNDAQLKFAVQQAISNLTLNEYSKDGAEKFAAETIATGYVPFGREGSWQVRVQAVDPKTGRIYKLSESYRSQLFFAQVDGKADALRMSERAQALFDSIKSKDADGNEASGIYDMEVLDGDKYVIRKVKLVAKPETARQTPAVVSEANLNEIVSALTRFSITITPEERDRLIQGLKSQNDSARRRLKRENTPGEDPNTTKYVSQHLESTASVVARKENRHRLDRLFDESDPDSKNLWYGSEVEYNRRKNNWELAQKDPNMSEQQKLAAKMEYIDYHYTYKIKEAEQQGNRFMDRGRRAVAFMESQTNVDYTDFGSGEAASTARTWTTFAFMGASVATAVLNYVALATNVLPSFSGYNEKNNFGGGFGWGRSSIELTKAITDTKGIKQSDTKFWDDLLSDPAKLKASGFTEVEARFMQKEVSGGTMQAALTNAMLGSARGMFKSGLRKAAAETWMLLFNYTEQHSRRATGLSAFRMAYARAIQEGKTPDAAFEVADRVAVEMIDNTLGEYAMFNRPAMFRGDVRQFLFMFKMFPVNSVQMLAALPRKEQLLALGILTLFSGLKGLPFAEDLMDLIDTTAQRLGLGPNALWKGSAERTLAEALDAIAPGMSPVLLRGVLNTITPANVADRTSLSNIIPGTGIALAGADVGRELIEIGGPLASFLQGAIATSTDVAKYGLETVGLKDDTTSISKIARESPVAMARALGDMYAYNNAGAIVNRKGYVVSNDLHIGTMLTRALGFYPASAVVQNDVVRMSTRIGDYQKEISGMYRGLYVAAKLSKDENRASEILEMVRNWNEAAQGTGLDIPRFNQSANRALREARRTASERYLKAAPRNMRPETQRISNLLGLDED